MPREWDAHESVVLMFFASRGMKPDVIAHAIRHKTGDVRTMSAVVGMIRRIRKEEVDAGHADPYDSLRRKWDLRWVDQWLLHQLPRHEVRDLITIYPDFDYDLIAKISEVQDFRHFTGPRMLLHA